jgi:outer membrane biosynthesis protein TonB
VTLSPRSPLLVTVLIVSTLGATGCLRAHAKSVLDSPPLDVPAPPPRDVETNESEPPQPVPLPQEPAHVTAPRPRAAPPPQSRPPAPQAAEPRVETPPPTAEPPKPEEPPKPAPTLQTTPATAESEVEKNVRATIARAAGDLSHIDYRALNAEARTQYDTAKSFIRQAETALRTKNLVFAKNLADKAAALAAQLPVK